MREITPRLIWTGNARDARELSKLLSLEIAAIVDLAIEEPPVQPPRDLIYCRFPLFDGAGNRPGVLRAAMDTTARLFASGIPTLVACSSGMSRSPAITAAALAAVQSMPLDDALIQVAENGPHDVSPSLWSEVERSFQKPQGKA